MLKAWIAAAAVAAAAWSGAAFAQNAPTVSTLDDAAWLAGRWIGEGLGGTVEETWAPPMGGQMVGHFRLMREGAPVFYEIMLMEVVEGGVQMRVKHFNPDFVSWEEKDGWHAFAPAGADEDALRFQGLTLRRLDDQTAEFIVTLRYPDGVRDETLRMRRAPL
ncbi:MAG: hypothetical protein GC189_10915 [Alphaproteobacteria bacterium]|nr:hypothetical protein [Alphaproteobacteria bacterium]